MIKFVLWFVCMVCVSLGTTKTTKNAPILNFNILVLATHVKKHIGVAAWLECWLSHLGGSWFEPWS